MTKKKDCGCNKKKPIIELSTPGGKEFNTPYPMGNEDSTYNEHYFDTNRNGKDNIPNEEVEKPIEIVEFHTKLDIVLRNIAKIFSKLVSKEAICARIDDKIMRIKNKGLVSATEDTLTDLIGYLLLLKMSMKK